jgi:hypothetical protein
LKKMLLSYFRWNNFVGWVLFRHINILVKWWFSCDMYNTLFW